MIFLSDFDFNPTGTIRHCANAIFHQRHTHMKNWKCYIHILFLGHTFFRFVFLGDFSDRKQVWPWEPTGRDLRGGETVRGRERAHVRRGQVQCQLLESGVYKVPYNLIFFPFPIFLNLYFLSRIFHSLTFSSLNILAYHPTFNHSISFRTALIFPSPPGNQSINTHKRHVLSVRRLKIFN